MLETNIREQIISLIHHQVVPAVGCTEPMAVALCVARAAELLGSKPEKVRVLLSANILKNAMGVGIPGTGMIGLPIAIALGALIGKSEYQLEVIKELISADVDIALLLKYRNEITIPTISSIPVDIAKTFVWRFMTLPCECGTIIIVNLPSKILNIFMKKSFKALKNEIHSF